MYTLDVRTGQYVLTINPVFTECFTVLLEEVCLFRKSSITVSKIRTTNTVKHPVFTWVWVHGSRLEEFNFFDYTLYSLYQHIFIIAVTYSVEFAVGFTL